MRRSNQLSYEATDVGSWSFVGSDKPVRNECEMIYEIFHIAIHDNNYDYDNDNDNDNDNNNDNKCVSFALNETQK